MARGIEWRREAPPAAPAALTPWGRRREVRRAHEADAERVAELLRRWRATCYTAGLAEDTESCAGIPGAAFPEVRSVVLGSDSDRLMVETIPGQVAKDYQAQAHRIAAGMGVPRVRIRQRGGSLPGYLIVELLRVDPLAQPVMLPTGARLAEHPVLMLGCETGEDLRVSLLDSMHIICQGQTRSGKTRWVYGLLGQLCGCVDVRICGSDITGRVARAFAGTRHEDGWATGSNYIEAHAEALEAVVAEMDRRNAPMPPRVDVYPVSEAEPLLFVVVEELAGLVEAAAAADAVRTRPSRGMPATPKLADRIKGALKRLMAEGAKVGIRVLLPVQRAEAGIIGGFARAQASLRLSFRVDDAESVRMLHPLVDPVLALEHATAEPAIALVSGPGLSLTRGRAPHMPDYATYVDLVQQRSGPAVTRSFDVAA